MQGNSFKILYVSVFKLILFLCFMNLKLFVPFGLMSKWINSRKITKIVNSSWVSF